MVPLQLFKTSAVSLRKSQWSLIDPGVLSPWRVMSWGIRQLRGFVVGSDSLDASPRLQVQELVLVENLKVAWVVPYDDVPFGLINRCRRLRTVR